MSAPPDYTEILNRYAGEVDQLWVYEEDYDGVNCGKPDCCQTESVAEIV